MLRAFISLIKNLPILGSDQLDFVPPAGSTLIIDKIKSFGLHQDFEAILIWDATGANPQYLFNTSVVGEFLSGEMIYGDGVKKLRLKIVNQYLDSTQAVGLSVGYKQY